MKHFLSTLIFVSFLLFANAQTTGPTQPEVMSFTPVTANDMVDKYTGDFMYNIPLMVVPGPDGGVPINAAYNAAVQVESAASWIGLGWNLNTGAIVRNKRGVPDDFNGEDKMDKTFYIKDRKNIAIGLGISPVKIEVFSADLGLTGNLTMYYDNYSGVGVRAGFDLVPTHEMQEGSSSSDGAWSLGLDFDSKEGISLSPSLSMDHLMKKDKSGKGGKGNKGVGKFLQTLQGVWDHNASFRHGTYFRPVFFRTINGVALAGIDIKSYNTSYGLSFASHSPVAPLSYPTNTTSIKLATTLDLALPFLKNKLTTVSANLSTTKITQPRQSLPIYGTLYAGNIKSEDKEHAIMDYERDNDVVVSKNTPALPVTINTFDVYNIQGHGIGGSFRLFRNDVGQFRPPLIESRGSNVDAGVDFGVAFLTIDAGTDINYAQTNSYTGAWKEKRISALNDYSFRKSTTANPLFEPSYFKIIGESTPMTLAEWNSIDGDNPVAFDLSSLAESFKKPFTFKSKAFSTYNNGRNRLSVNQAQDRNPRATNIEYKTNAELKSINNSGTYSANYIVRSNRVEPINYEDSNKKGHHINAIAVRKTNGVVYNYDLPAYNWNEEKVVFATDAAAISDGSRLVNINSKDRVANGVENEYYSREVTPGYVHTYFLTGIQSMDYVDIKNDGYTDDDLGTWTKYYYEEIKNYKWRFPFDDQKATFIEGYITNEKDRKGTYTQGHKDLYYVKAIETKTHIAIFETSTSALVDAENRKTQAYLKKISLYSKSDPNYTSNFFLNSNHNLTPIQEVHFAYDYSLKSSDSAASTVPNFDATKASNDNMLAPVGGAGQNGTLTLKQLWFTYKNNKVGADSKYHFEYENNKPHPIAYSQDRWGSCQPKTTDENGKVFDTYENPYVLQDKEMLDEYASLWCLSKITLPSDGEISVEYERDDYAYVQDKQATEYVPIAGIGGEDGNINFLDGTTPSILGRNNRIYFKAASKAEAEARLKGIKDLNFKAFMFLNRVNEITGSTTHRDYVSGYLEDNSYSVGYDERGYGYIQVDYINPTNSSILRFHPFQITTLQYIRNYRPDIQVSFEFTPNPIDFVSKNFTSLYNEVKSLTQGYYKESAKKGWGSIIEGTKPSYLKLKSIDKVKEDGTILCQKYGGGNRVKRIMLDPKSETDSIYGKEYEYTMPDGSSSGVAEMEPMTGREENALVKPEWYKRETGKKILYIQKETEDSFVEAPVGISLYPAPNVGYARVLERSLSNAEVSNSQDGIAAYEFYTAKDFPTRVKRTSDPFKSPAPPVKVTIPFIGTTNINNSGFSMGHVFEISNGIYGRAKATSVYPYSTGEPEGAPISKIEYKYKTKSAKVLDSKVRFLKREGETVEAFLGKQYDFNIEQFESSTVTVGGGIRPDIKVVVAGFIPIPLPSLVPSLQYYENTSSYLTTTKIIYNAPILDHTVEYKDGSKVINSNLYYDYETGEPIITGVTNEFADTIFNYNFPAHWSYPRMKGAYKNYGAHIAIKKTTDGYKIGRRVGNNDIYGELDDILAEGDELIYGGKRHYITSIDYENDLFTLEDRTGTAPLITSFRETRIDKSAYRNLQTLNKGSVVTLEDYSNLNFDSNDRYYNSLLHQLFDYAQERDLFTGCRGVLDDGGGKIHSLMLGACGIRFDDCIIQLGLLQFNQSVDSNYIGVIAYIPDGNKVFVCEDIYGGFKIDNVSSDFDFTSIEYISEESTGTDIVIRYRDDNETYRISNLDYSYTVGRITDDPYYVFIPCIDSCMTSETERNRTSVFQVSGIDFRENWELNFSGIDKRMTDFRHPETNELATINEIYKDTLANPYAYGRKGIPRLRRTWTYLGTREQHGALSEDAEQQDAIVNLREDGTFEYYPFIWQEGYDNEEYGWRWVNEITQYNANGNSEEGRNRLLQSSSSLSGYKGYLVTAVAQNAAHQEIAFDSFEDYAVAKFTNDRQEGHGNLNFNAYDIVNEGHTGSHSLRLDGENRLSYIANSEDAHDFFQPQADTTYYISFWTKLQAGFGVHHTDIPPTAAQVVADNTVLLEMTVDKSTRPIDGWYRVEGVFKFPAEAQYFVLQMAASNSENVLLDDIRIQPFNSAMQAYVYDRTDYRLSAILDDRNYFVEFIYDSEGGLIQKNVETENGIKTLSINRTNVSRK